jgi:hypothetical protein
VVVSELVQQDVEELVGAGLRLRPLDEEATPAVSLWLTLHAESLEDLSVRAVAVPAFHRQSSRSQAHTAT